MKNHKSLVNSVVKVLVTSQSYIVDEPWQRESLRRGSGSGVYITVDGRGYILTAAHVVADAKLVQIQTPHTNQKMKVEIELVAHECDLALLRVDDAEMRAADMTPAELAARDFLPELTDDVHAIGFPVGGEQISITKGVVSRIEIQQYAHSRVNLLAVTVDAAVNPGNSGGPAFQDGSVIGIVIQGMGFFAENINHIVPTFVVHHILDSFKQKKEDHRFPHLGIHWQKLENRLLRDQLNLADNQCGVLVRDIEYSEDSKTSACAVLKKHDVLVEIDGTPVHCDGTVQFSHIRTNLDIVVHKHFLGDTVPLKIIRNGKQMDVKFRLEPLRRLVPKPQYDMEPRYALFRGFLFQPLTANFLQGSHSFGGRSSYTTLKYLYQSGHLSEDRKEVVVFSNIFEDTDSVSFKDLLWKPIVCVNGEKFRDLDAFVALVDRSLANEETRGYTKIETECGSILVFTRESHEKARREVYPEYNITNERNLKVQKSVSKLATEGGDENE